MSYDRKSVLLISNDQIITRDLRKKFDVLGFDVHLTTTPPKLDNKHFNVDMVIIDSEFISREKSDVIAQFKNAARPFPIVASLSDYKITKASTALLQQADAFIVWPPPDLDSLRTIIARFLNPLDTVSKFRTYVRLKKRMQMTWQSSSSEIKHLGETINVGQGGLFMREGSVLMSRYEVINFTLAAPAGNVAIRGIGVVRWISTPGMRPLEAGFGIEFISVENTLNDVLKKAGEG